MKNVFNHFGSPWLGQDLHSFSSWPARPPWLGTLPGKIILAGNLIFAHHALGQTPVFVCTLTLLSWKILKNLTPATCRESKLLSMLLLNSSLFCISSIWFSSPLNLDCRFNCGSYVLCKEQFCKERLSSLTCPSF